MVHFPQLALFALKVIKTKKKYLKRMQIKWFSIHKIRLSQPGQCKLYDTKNFLLLRERIDFSDFYYIAIF